MIITEPTLLQITSATGTTILCNGDCKQYTRCNSEWCGTGALTYDWVDDGTGASVGTTATLANMCAGSYTITVTDANGCTATSNVVVTEPTALAIVMTSSDANCGQADGQGCGARNWRNTAIHLPVG